MAGRLSGILLVLGGVLYGIVGGAPSGGAIPQEIRVLYAQPSAVFAPLWVARDRGLFSAHGLAVSLVQATGTTAMAALASGEAQVFGGGATEVAGIDAGGGDVVMLAAGSNYPIFSLYVAPQIRSVEDLAGKAIAVTRLGTSTDTAARIMLEHYGLGGKVHIVDAGGTMAGILAALTKGIVAGGVVSPPTTAKAAAAGFRELVNGFRLGVPMTQSSLAVRRAYLVNARDAVLRFMKGYLAGWAFVHQPANRVEVVDTIARYTRSSPSEASVAYDAFAPLWAQATVPRVDPQGVANVLRFSTNPRVRALAPAQLIDSSVLEDLVRSGYVDSLYRK
jgi:NitT/TauT family transport system substrate-binding protein